MDETSTPRSSYDPLARLRAEDWKAYGGRCNADVSEDSEGEDTFCVLPVGHDGAHDDGQTA